MLWHRETHINPQRNRQIIVDQAGIELTTSRLSQLRQLPVVQHVRFTPLNSGQKTQLQSRARGCTGQMTTCLECTWCQFQHLLVLILNSALALAIYIFVGLILMLWHRETHINPKGTDKLSWTRRGSNSRPPD